MNFREQRIFPVTAQAYRVRANLIAHIVGTRIFRRCLSPGKIERFSSGKEVFYFQTLNSMIYRVVALCLARNLPVTSACGISSRSEASSRNSFPQLWQVTST